MFTVLAIDDQPGVLHSLQHALALEGYNVVTAASCREGLERAQQHRPHVVIVDLKLPDAVGSGIARELRTLLPGIAVVAMSGDSVLLSQATGFDARLEKPLRTEALLEALQGITRGQGR